MHAITLVIIYNYVLFGFRSNIILIILYEVRDGLIKVNNAYENLVTKHELYYTLNVCSRGK